MTTTAIRTVRELQRRPARKRYPLGFKVGATVLAILAVGAALAPLIAPSDPFAVNLSLMNAAPGTEGHLLGTDGSGRDILSRLLFGARTSVIGPIIAVVISVTVGVTMGAVAGWYGGWIDQILTRIIDFLFAFPGLLTAVLAVALFGPGILAPAIGIAIAYAPVIARLTRSVVLSERSKLYVMADQALGFSDMRTLAQAVIPNVAAVIMSQCIVSFGYAMVDLAALSFLGLGVQAPAADWGLMLNESLTSLLIGAWWVMVIPAAALVTVVVSVNLVGEGLMTRAERGMS